MANEKEIIGILETLLTAFPAYKPVHPEKLVEIFTQQLSKFPVQVLQTATNQVIKTELRYFPSIGKILQASEAAYTSYWEAYKRRAARRIELEDRFYLHNELDPEEWEQLAVEMDSAGMTNSATRLRERAKRFAEELVTS